MGMGMELGRGAFELHIFIIELFYDIVTVLSAFFLYGNQGINLCHFTLYFFLLLSIHILFWANIWHLITWRPSTF